MGKEIANKNNKPDFGLDNNELVDYVLRSDNPPRMVVGLKARGYDFGRFSTVWEKESARLSDPNKKSEAMLNITVCLLPRLARAVIRSEQYYLDSNELFQGGIYWIQEELSILANQGPGRSEPDARSMLDPNRYVSGAIADYWGVKPHDRHLVDAFLNEIRASGETLPPGTIVDEISQNVIGDQGDIANVKKKLFRILEIYRAFGDRRFEPVQDDPELRPVESEILELESWKSVVGLFKNLPQRSQKIIVDRYLEGKTIEEISRENGVTNERIRQLVGKAIEKLGGPKAKSKNRLSEPQQGQQENANIETQPPTDETKQEVYWSEIKFRQFLHSLFDSAELLRQDEYPEKFECNQTWIDAIEALESYSTESDFKYWLIGMGRDNRISGLGQVAGRNAMPDFEAERKEWQAKIKESKTHSIIGEMAIGYGPFINTDLLYRFITDRKDLAFLMVRSRGRDYWVFRAQETINRDVTANAKDYVFCRNWWLNQLFNTSRQNSPNIFVEPSETRGTEHVDKREVGLIICAIHNLLVYERDIDGKFKRVT